MRDFLAECNNLGVTEDEFRGIWCIRCVRKDCVRSHQGKSKFEARVSTWEERLFTNVPRMPESDPRYPKLADQDFVEGESWGGKSTSVQVPANWEPAPQEPEAAPPPDPAPLPSGFVSKRVPHQSGRTLGDVQVVKPGAKIRLGGSKEPGEGGSSGVR
jgi:hypothetical protein